MGSDIAKEGFMNFAALMVSAALMSIGSYAAYCYIEEPHIASNRLNAQAKADATVEIMQAKVRQGAELTYSGGVLTLDGTVVRVPPSCSILDSYKGATGYFVKCWDTSIGNGDHDENNLARMGIARLTTSNPCGSELFPSTKWTAGGERAGMCTESENQPLGDLLGGHFDLDSYGSPFVGGYMSKGLHVHEWNYKYPSRTFVELMDGVTNMDGVPKAIPEVITNTNTKFAITIVNPKLSPLVQISINGKSISMSDFSTNLDTIGTLAIPKAYTLSSLQSIKITMPNDILPKAGLIPTSTGYVNTSSPLPGKCGEYRNGALVVQIVELDPSTNTYYQGASPINSFTSGCPSTSTVNSNGGLGLVTNKARVLYEASIFWHGPKAIYNASSPYVPLNSASVAQYIQ